MKIAITALVVCCLVGLAVAAPKYNAVESLQSENQDDSPDVTATEQKPAEDESQPSEGQNEEDKTEDKEEDKEEDKKEDEDEPCDEHEHESEAGSDDEQAGTVGDEGFKLFEGLSIEGQVVEETK